MDKQELEDIYYELEEINAILWIFSNINDDADVNKHISITACHYQEKMEKIIKNIEKYL